MMADDIRTDSLPHRRIPVGVDDHNCLEVRHRILWQDAETGMQVK